MKTHRLMAIVMLVWASIAAASYAQDSHYWTMQYGPRSSLLGGAVIGSVDDVSATYYNPGALGLADTLVFAVSTNVFEYSLIALRDGGGEGVDLGTSKSGLRPSLVAGAITRNLFGSGTVAYSALTRMKGTQDLSGYAILSAEDIPPDAGLADAVGLVQYTGEFDEVWAGLSYAQPLGSHFGIGVSWYGAFRSQRRRAETVSEGIGESGAGFASIALRGGRYSSFRTLFKFGAVAAVGPLAAGVTLTTPSIHILGTGELGINDARFSTDTTSLAATVQTDLAAEYKSPLSVGIGGAWRIGATRIHASAEWYDAVAPYVVIQGREFVTQEPEQAQTPTAVHEMGEVLNWGAGIEHGFSRRFNIYLSYYTDNSALNDEIERASLSILPIDISTILIGSDFSVSSARFTLGAGFGWGNEIDRGLSDALQQEDPNFQATFVYRGVRLIFGFEIGV